MRSRTLLVLAAFAIVPSFPTRGLVQSSTKVAASDLNAPGLAATYQEARVLYQQGDIPKAEAIYQTIVADQSASARDRSGAFRELARIAWLVDGNGQKAIAILARSLPTDPDPCPAAVLYGQVLNDGPARSQTPSQLAPWAQRCAETEPEVSLQVTRSYILAAAAKGPSRRAAATRTARAAWEGMTPVARKGLEGSRQRMRIGLLEENVDESLAGWRDFFWLGEGSAPQAFGMSDADVVAAFRSGGRLNATKEEALRLASLLVRAGFADEAHQLASDRALASSRGALAAKWDLIRRYLTMRDALVATALAHDRLYAREHRDNGQEYKTSVEKIMREAVKGIGRPGEKPSEVLYETWGLYGPDVGNDDGVKSLHLGHTVVDEQQEVVQGERRGWVHFVALDNMIANSFWGWLNDAVGGWATEDTIVQVRPFYADGVLARLAIAKPGPARQRQLERIKEGEAQDRTLVANGKLVYLPGMARRISLQAIDQLAAELRASNPTPEAFDRQFLKTHAQRSTYCSITLHEGRHALDKAQFTGPNELSSEELEYRAKLSEISFCPSPRIIFSNIHNSGLGGEDPLEIANLRILTAYAAWIAAHRNEVAGFDPNIPDFAQLDKLTDDQLRAVAADLDREVTKQPSKATP